MFLDQTGSKCYRNAPNFLWIICMFLDVTRGVRALGKSWDTTWQCEGGVRRNVWMKTAGCLERQLSIQFWLLRPLYTGIFMKISTCVNSLPNTPNVHSDEENKKTHRWQQRDKRAHYVYPKINWDSWPEANAGCIDMVQRWRDRVPNESIRTP